MEKPLNGGCFDQYHSVFSMKKKIQKFEIPFKRIKCRCRDSEHAGVTLPFTYSLSVIINYFDTAIKQWLLVFHDDHLEWFVVRFENAFLIGTSFQNIFFCRYCHDDALRMIAVLKRLFSDQSNSFWGFFTRLCQDAHTSDSRFNHDSLSSYTTEEMSVPRLRQVWLTVMKEKRLFFLRSTMDGIPPYEPFGKLPNTFPIETQREGATLERLIEN